MSHHLARPQVITLPARLRLALDATVNLMETVVAPLVVFYVVLMFAGLHYALIGSLTWAYAAILVRVITRKGPSALLVATAGLTTIQVAMSALTSSAEVYLLQPTITTYLFAVAFLVTIPFNRPLIQRLAEDFCPLPAELVKSAPIRNFFQRISLLWAGVLLVNASLTLGMLLTAGVWSVPVAGTASIPFFLAGLAASYIWFRRSLRTGGYALAWAPSARKARTAPPSPSI
jgi:intracellular septation protein A